MKFSNCHNWEVVVIDYMLRLLSTSMNVNDCMLRPLPDVEFD